MIPIPYTEECMTGFEYAAAGLLLQEGMLREGVEVIAAIRDRYDGKKRNPFAEIECGSSYARSMASFYLPAIFSGFRFDMSKKSIGFAPIEDADNYEGFWAVNGAWGSVRIDREQITLSVRYGTLPLDSYRMAHETAVTAVTAVTADGRALGYTVNGRDIHFDTTAETSHELVIRLG
jgi:hypothetical protein